MYTAVNYRVNPEISVPNILWHTAKAVVAVGKAVRQTVRFIASVFVWLFAAAGENAKGIATLVSIVAVTVVLAAVWQVGVGVGVIAALTFCLKRRGKI